MIRKFAGGFLIFIGLVAISNNYGILPSYYNMNKVFPLKYVFMGVLLILLFWCFRSTKNRNKRIWISANILLIILIPYISSQFFFHGLSDPICNTRPMRTTVLPSNYWFQSPYCGMIDNISGAPKENLHALGGYAIFYTLFTLLYSGIVQGLLLIKKFIQRIITSTSLTRDHSSHQTPQKTHSDSHQKHQA
ncbi:MAG: hypothetical protein ACJASQ_003059 [Crocinitomicaceae bacterium]|jgi:hypothetical protein